jgi:hypothetical protein
MENGQEQNRGLLVRTTCILGERFRGVIPR